MKQKFERGEMWLGDCLELMADIPDGSVDMVFTSPPYNLREGMEDKGGLRIGHSGSAWSGGTLGAGYNSYDDAMPYEAYCAWQKQVLETLWSKLSDDGVIFYNHKPRVVKASLRLPFFADLPMRQVIIWDRGSGFNHTQTAFKPVCEWVVVYAKPSFRLKDKSASGVGDVWRINAERNNSHPAPFPVELVRRAIDATNCQVILDPFGGSGTVAVAAHEAGRRYLSFERDVDYFFQACDRVAAL